MRFDGSPSFEPARENDPRYELLIPQAAEAVLLVEFHGDSADSLREQLDHACQQLLEKSRLASSCYVAADPLDYDLLWQLARHYVPLLYRSRGTTRPIPFVEDIAVPPTTLPEFLQQLQTTLKQQQITASIFGHALHGQLHVRPFLDLANPEDVRKMETLATQMYSQVWELGGTISGEHGDGLSRTPYLAGQYGTLTEAFREVKELFDPQTLFNPGKVVPSSPSRLTDNLRPTGYPELVSLQLDWQPEEMAHVARACNGCATCRSQEPDTRMCPIFRYAPREEASPRAKANLTRGILAGTLPFGTVFDDSFRKVAELCVHCHMCRLECPASVDIPKLMVEAKAAYLETNGQGLHDWVLTRVDSLCATASRLSRLTNWAVANRLARWLIEKTLGIAQGAKFPGSRGSHFCKWRPSRRLHRAVPSSSLQGKFRRKSALFCRHLCELLRYPIGRSDGRHSGAQPDFGLRSQYAALCGLADDHSGNAGAGPPDRGAECGFACGSGTPRVYHPLHRTLRRHSLYHTNILYYWLKIRMPNWWRPIPWMLAITCGAGIGRVNYSLILPR